MAFFIFIYHFRISLYFHISFQYLHTSFLYFLYSWIYFLYFMFEFCISFSTFAFLIWFQCSAIDFQFIIRVLSVISCALTARRLTLFRRIIHQFLGPTRYNQNQDCVRHRGCQSIRLRIDLMSPSLWWRWIWWWQGPVRGLSKRSPCPSWTPFLLLIDGCISAECPDRSDVESMS